MYGREYIYQLPFRKNPLKGIILQQYQIVTKTGYPLKALSTANQSVTAIHLTNSHILNTKEVLIHQHRSSYELNEISPVCIKSEFFAYFGLKTVKF